MSKHETYEVIVCLALLYMNYDMTIAWLTAAASHHPIYAHAVKERKKTGSVR